MHLYIFRHYFVYSVCECPLYYLYNFLYSSFEGWEVSGVKSGSVIIPDVSRVLKRPSDFFHFSPKDTQHQLFAQPRETNRYLDNSYIHKSL